MKTYDANIPRSFLDFVKENSCMGHSSCERRAAGFSFVDVGLDLVKYPQGNNQVFKVKSDSCTTDDR